MLNELPNSNFSIQFRSKLTQKLFSFLPNIRGFSIYGSLIFKLLPIDHFAVIKVKDKSFELDLRYRSQISIVKNWPPEAAEIRFVLKYLQPGDVFFDLGSNWGLYTMIAAAVVGEDGLVVAVELNPEPFIRLLRLIHKSALTNVVAFNVALSDVSGDHVGIVKPWYRNDTASFFFKAIDEQKGTITTRSLDKLWKQVDSPQVRMAKLDVEGF